MNVFIKYNNGQVIIQHPSSGYMEGKTYTIIISKDLKSKNSSVLNKEVRMHFTVKPFKSSNNNEFINVTNSNIGTSVLADTVKAVEESTAYKVGSISNTSNGNSAVELKQPALDEIFTKLDISTHQNITSSNIISSEFVKGVRFYAGNNSNSLNKTNTVSNNFAYSKVKISDATLEDKFEIEIDKDAKLGVHGKLSLKNATISTELKYEKLGNFIPTKIDKMSVKFQGIQETQFDANLEVSGDVDLAEDDEEDVIDAVPDDVRIIGSITYGLGRAFVPVKGSEIPITIGATIYIGVTMKGEVKAEIGYSASNSYYIENGFEYKDGKLTEFNEFKLNSNESSIGLNGEASLKMGVGLNILGQIPALAQCSLNLNANLKGEGRLQIGSGNSFSNDSLESRIEGQALLNGEILFRAGLGVEIGYYKREAYTEAKKDFEIFNKSFQVNNTIKDDFSKDSGLWEYSNKAYLDAKNNYLVLTENKDWQKGGVWLKQSINRPFTAKFKYKIGGGTGADGLVFMFHKEKVEDLTDGGYMGFSGKGYAIELDGSDKEWNTWDPPYSHVGIIKDSVENHLQTKEDLKVEDNMWHNIEVIVNRDSIIVKEDGEEVLNYKGRIDLTFNNIGFAAGTGTANNYHIIDDVEIIYSK